CYTESDGALTCVTCHDPHAHARAPVAQQEAKCLTCHGPGPAPTAAAGAVGGRSERTPRTTCPVDPARGCIGCHMPNAWYQPTHSFKTDHYIRVRERDVPEH